MSVIPLSTTTVSGVEVFCNDLATSSALMKSIVDDLCAVAWETECASQHLIDLLTNT